MDGKQSATRFFESALHQGRIRPLRPQTRRAGPVSRRLLRAGSTTDGKDVRRDHLSDQATSPPRLNPFQSFGDYMRRVSFVCTRKERVIPPRQLVWMTLVVSKVGCAPAKRSGSRRFERELAGSTVQGPSAALRRKLHALRVSLRSFHHRPKFGGAYIFHHVDAALLQVNLHNGVVCRANKCAGRTNHLRPRHQTLLVCGTCAQHHEKRQKENTCNSHITTQVQRPGPRDAAIATIARWPG